VLKVVTSPIENTYSKTAALTVTAITRSAATT
jgi:hypothetical protein